MPRKKSAAKRAREATKKESTKQNAPVLETKLRDPPRDNQNNDAVPKDLSEAEDESASSEEEDDYGELVTEEVESGINQVLEAIKNNDKKLFDPSVRFFEDPESAAAKIARAQKEKPIYLKDYHRMNILSGNALKDEDDEEMQTVDGKQSFVAQQKEEKDQLLGEIRDQFAEKEGSGDDSEDEGNFLVKKTPSNARKVPDASLPDPQVDDEKFLEAFVSKHAWIPKEGDREVNLDGPGMEEDDEEFDNAAEQFENAYNFRYEDPNAAEIVSYARTQATLRRSTSNSRRRKRDEEKREKTAEKVEKETAVQKKKKEKVNKLTDVLEQVRKEYGADINEAMVQKLTATLLNGDFKDDHWDSVISELFNEEYYNQEGKPTWDEDDEIMGDFYHEENKEESTIEDNKEHDGAEEGPARKKSRKELKEEKRSKKKDKKKVSEMVESALENNKLALVDEVEEERKSRARTKEEEDVKFRYREVSPESFGLTNREIFEADDGALNDFIGLKKFAPYRAKELRAKDRRKVTKSRRMREWKKKVFGSEEGLNDDASSQTQSQEKKHSKKTRK
ncbi:LAQU0S23e01024g1_1 [Lachancea quebecensis]|uniref:LAQU0S23e01024g1_1 n=1 Tax=Lachancea quebecensis TaxID=1654605 RepID=A0A0P1KXR0_9SACH|nr:LAQU0S23e01024g1_1 [Lachancea quebecensis]